MGQHISTIIINSVRTVLLYTYSAFSFTHKRGQDHIVSIIIEMEPVTRPIPVLTVIFCINMTCNDYGDVECYPPGQGTLLHMVCTKTWDFTKRHSNMTECHSMVGIEWDKQHLWHQHHTILCLCANIQHWRPPLYNEPDVEVITNYWDLLNQRFG